MRMRTWKHLLLIVFLALPLVLASDCPGSSPLDPGNGDTTVTLKNTRISSTNRFVDDPVGDVPNFIFPDFAGVQMLRIWIEPIDPDAVAAAPSIPLELLGQVPLETDWVFDPTVKRLAVLSNGVYRVTQVDLGSLFLRDGSDGMGGNSVDPANWDDPDNPLCQDFIRVFDNQGVDTRLLNLGGEVLFEVKGSELNSLTLRLDAEAFLDAWYQTTTCSSCNCPALYDPMDPSTLNCQCFQESFNLPAFRNLAPSYLTFE